MHRERHHPEALIVGDDPDRLAALETLLRPHCARLQRTSSEAALEAPLSGLDCPFVIVTSTPRGIVPEQFFRRLRRQFPCSRLILVIDHIAPAVEISARSAGTLFIGSLASFRDHVAPIFESVAGRRLRSTPPGRSQTPAVMLVDDEPNVLHSIHRALKEIPCTVHPFDNPAEALANIERIHPAVVVSDYRMQGMNGIELLSRVKRKMPSAVRLIMTGHADFETVLQAINHCQAYKFIQKPWDAGRLREDVLNALAYARLAAGLGITASFSDYLRSQSAERMAGVHELAIAVCHEMGQPLQIISGWIELLCMDAKGLNATLQYRMQAIHTEVKRMAEILGHLRRLESYRTVDYPGGASMFDIYGAAGTPQMTSEHAPYLRCSGKKPTYRQGGNL